ncbi:MAG: phosphoglycerate mutase [Propionibacterium sp.]|nr:phosphoglycerate mutase [Propionibacterium sp.]
MLLILMRHSKTEGAHPQGDHARELLERGRGDAARVGELLADYDVDHALVSTAARTRQTFDALGLDIPVEYLDTIYHQDVEEIAQRIAEVPEDVQTLLIIGHAPSIPGMAMELARDAGSHAEADDVARHFPTSMFVVFDVEGAWEQLADPGAFDSVRLARIERP